LPVNVDFRPAGPADYPEVRRITRDAYVRAGHFTAGHPYMGVLDNVEHRAQHTEVWVAEASGAVVAAVTLTFAGQPYSEIARGNELEFWMLAVDPAVQGNGVGRAVVRQVIEHAQSLPDISGISITSAIFTERAYGLHESLGFRVPVRDWWYPARTYFSGFSGWRCKDVCDPSQSESTPARLRDRTPPRPEAAKQRVDRASSNRPADLIVSGRPAAAPIALVMLRTFSEGRATLKRSALFRPGT
jgi:GNAT superfamily N-acetyltransferase